MIIIIIITIKLMLMMIEITIINNFIAIPHNYVNYLIIIIMS